MSKKVKFMRWECDVEKATYEDDSIALQLTHPKDGKNIFEERQKINLKKS